MWDERDLWREEEGSRRRQAVGFKRIRDDEGNETAQHHVTLCCTFAVVPFRILSVHPPILSFKPFFGTQWQSSGLIFSVWDQNTSDAPTHTGYAQVRVHPDDHGAVFKPE